jgi:hypothetical protein
MKVAFHFNADLEPLGVLYGETVLRNLLCVLAKKRELRIESFVFAGDFALRDLCQITEQMSGDSICFRFDQATYTSALDRWLTDSNFAWRTFTNDSLEVFKKRNVFVVLFDSIDIAQARSIDHVLWKLPYYIGAIDVSYRCSLNVSLYQMFLIRRYRLHEDALDVLVDKVAESKPCKRDIKELRRFGFVSVRIRNFDWEHEKLEFVT